MRPFRFAIAASVSVLAFSSAYAADAVSPANSGGQQAAAANAPEQGLEEVTVTAERRSEKILQVPATITATTGLQLKNEGLKEISDLQFNTPSFVVENGVGYTQIYIRGVGNNIYVGADPSVALYVDDVPRIYGSMVNSFVNVDRIEVLQGAQGGLYGRNATGGVVNIITREPGDQFNGDVKFGYGDKNTGDVEAYLNIPLTENIEWNIAAERLWHDDYVKNVLGPDPLTAAMFPNGGGAALAKAGIVTPAQTAAFFNQWIQPVKGLDNQDFYSGDTKLTVHVSEQFKLLFDADFSRKRDSEGNQWYSITPGVAQAFTTSLLGRFGITAAFPPGYFRQVGAFQTTEPLSIGVDALRDYGGSVKAIYSLPGFDLENILAYRAQQTLYEENTPIPITSGVSDVRNRKDYQYEELRAVSNGEGPFHWLAGATYLDDFYHGNTSGYTFPPLYTIPAFAATLQNLNIINTRVRNWSVYGDVTYDLTSKISIEGSLRYIDETNHSVFVYPVPGKTVGEVDRALPAGTLSYKLEDGGNIYARYAEGFKAGGVNPVVGPSAFPSSYGEIFGPESVKTYEVGFKDNFLERRLQFTTDVFYNDYTGLQIATTGNVTHSSISEAIINAGAARTYGWEATADWRVIQPLTIGLRADYLEAEYLSFQNLDCSVLNCFNYSHSRMLFSPKWQEGVNVDLDLPLNDQYRLVANFLGAYTGTTIGSISTNPAEPGFMKPYFLANLRVGIHTADDKYAVTLYVKNLFDREYSTFASTGSFTENRLWGDPRIIGGEFEVKFD